MQLKNPGKINTFKNRPGRPIRPRGTDPTPTSLECIRMRKMFGKFAGPLAQRVRSSTLVPFSIFIFRFSFFDFSIFLFFDVSMFRFFDFSIFRVFDFYFSSFRFFDFAIFRFSDFPIFRFFGFSIFRFFDFSIPSRPEVAWRWEPSSENSNSASCPALSMRILGSKCSFGGATC